MMDWIDIIVKFIIPLLGAIITYYVVPLLKEKKLYDYVEIGVKAAEQIFGSKMGEEKFEYVKEWVKGKFNISDEDLKNIIEAVVYEMNKNKKTELKIETTKTSTKEENIETESEDKIEEAEDKE